MKFLREVTTCAVLALGASSAHAAVVTLDFEGLKDLEAINGFYNGGTGSLGSSGVNYGVEFSSNSLAVIDSDAGGSGNIGNEPTPDTVLFFLTGAAATLNVAAGFDTGFSFFYSSISNSGSIDVYDGLNATGNILTSLFLPQTPRGSGDPTGDFNIFEAIGVGFGGIAKSIDFGGTENQIAFDNITFSSTTPGDTGGTGGPSPVPVPAGFPLLLAGLASFGILRWRR